MTAYSFSQLIDFTRTTPGTFVGSNGLIQTTPQSRNLLTFTQEFDNAAWVKAQTTPTANTTVAPDGTSTADTLTALAGAAVHNASQALSIGSGTLTFTVYAKAGTHSFIQLFHGSANAANFNVSTGAIGTVGAGISAAITAVGNGWYRCSYTATLSSVTTLRVAMISSATAAYNESWTATGTETVFLWGAQAEAASTATDYTRNVGGLFPPRFDYDPVTLAPRGILIEEQRTNLFVNSVFGGAASGTPGTAPTSWAALHVGGTLTVTSLGRNFAANSLRFTTSVNRQTITQNITLPTTGTVILTAQVELFTSTESIDQYLALFALPAGSAVQYIYNGANQSAAFVPPLGRGVFQLAVTTTGTGGAVTCRVGVGAQNNGTGNIAIWDIQAEQGTFATSYIPTVAGQVTRAPDQASIVAPMFAPWFNASAGTFVAEFDKLSTSVRGIVVNAGNTASAGSGSSVAVDGQNDGFVRAFIENVGSIEMVNGTLAAYTANTPIKGAVTYATNNGVGAAAGNVGTVDTTVVVPPMDALQIGAGRNNSLPASVFLNGHLRNVRFYPVRLSDLQLQALTQ